MIEINAKMADVVMRDAALKIIEMKGMTTKPGNNQWRTNFPVLGKDALLKIRIELVEY